MLMMIIPSLEEIAVLNGNHDAEKNGQKKSNGTGEDTPMQDSSDLSEAPPSDGETESGSAAPSARQSMRRAQAKERERARAKLASQKQALAETRRLDEEVNKCERRLEQIERDTDRDFIMTAKQAKEYGLIDDIIDRPRG